MKILKILQITPSYKPAYIYGGPIESVARLCEGLATAGHTVDVYTTTANGTSELSVIPNQRVIVDEVPVTYFARITKDPTHISPQLWKSLYKNCKNYDVVHIHSWWNILVIVAAIICHLKKVKVVISPRGMLSDYIVTATNSRAKQFIHSIAGRRALQQSLFHATSQIEYEECKKLIPGWQGFLLPNILTLPKIAVRKTRNEQFVLLFLSRVHPKKGIEFLLEALAVTHGIVLKIAGEGDEAYMSILKERIQALGIENRVEWLGWKGREEKFVELMKADLFVLTSFNENFANVVIEALHVGTPVLVSDQVGLAQFVKEENLGWVTELNADVIAKKLQEIILQREKQTWVHENGQRIIDKLFSERELIRQYVERFETMNSENKV